jgi:hypothetical protein
MSKATAKKVVEMPSVTANVSERAMLVRLSISMWRAIRTDEAVNQEVARKHGSDARMGSFKKYLIDPAHLAPMERRAGEAYIMHRRLTLPWSDQGFRVLSMAGYWKYTEEMRKLEAAFWKELDEEFLPNCPEYKRKAKKALGTLWEDTSWPSDIRSKYGFRVTPQPLPDSSDFRVQLGAEENARVKAEMDRWREETLNTAMKDVWARLYEVVKKMSERLHAFAPAKKKGERSENTFRDTLVSNITDVLDIVPVLNVMGSVELDRMAQDIREGLTRFEPDLLRQDENTRKDVARRADAIVAKMEAFL